MQLPKVAVSALLLQDRVSNENGPDSGFYYWLCRFMSLRGKGSTLGAWKFSTLWLTSRQRLPNFSNFELTATFDPTMRFKRSNSNLENFHDVFLELLLFLCC